MAVLTFDPVDLEDQISVTGAEVEDYYQANQSEFFSEESVDLAYVVVDRSAMAAAVEVTDGEPRSAYEAQKDRYMTPENRRIAHILVSTEDRTIEEARVLLESIQTELGAGTLLKRWRKYRLMTPAVQRRGETLASRHEACLSQALRRQRLH